MNITKEIEEMKSKIAIIEAELKKQENEPKDFELYLRFTDDKYWLLIGFNNSGTFRSIGCISGEGRCHFINEDLRRKNWEIWKENGFKVAKQEPVEWQKLKWTIDEGIRLRVYAHVVYNFKHKIPYTNIDRDNNFLKKDSDGRIHLF